MNTNVPTDMIIVPAGSLPLPPYKCLDYFDLNLQHHHYSKNASVSLHNAPNYS